MLLTPEDNFPKIQGKFKHRVDIYLFGKIISAFCILILVFITMSSFFFCSSCRKLVHRAQLFKLHRHRYYWCQEIMCKSTSIIKFPFPSRCFNASLAAIPSCQGPLKLAFGICTLGSASAHCPELRPKLNSHLYTFTSSKSSHPNPWQHS